MLKFSFTRQYYFFICILLSTVFLFGCGSRNTPAPVVGMYGGIPLKDRVKNSITTSAYTVKKGEKLCSRYYLRFYYNFLAFFNSLDEIFKTKNYYYALLKTIKIKSLPNIKSIGNINYDAKEQLDNIKTGKRKNFYEYNSFNNTRKLIHMD